MVLSCSLLYVWLLEVISKYELATGVLRAGTGNTEMNEMQFLIHVRTSKYLQNVHPRKPFSKLNIQCVFSLGLFKGKAVLCNFTLPPGNRRPQTVHSKHFCCRSVTKLYLILC